MVLDRIIELVAEQFTVDADEISEDTTFEDLGAEDMDITDLVYAVEDVFEMEISEDEANALETVADLADLVEAAMSAE